MKKNHSSMFFALMICLALVLGFAPAALAGSASVDIAGSGGEYHGPNYGVGFYEGGADASGFGRPQATAAGLGTGSVDNSGSSGFGMMGSGSVALGSTGVSGLAGQENGFYRNPSAGNWIQGYNTTEGSYNGNGVLGSVGAAEASGQTFGTVGSFETHGRVNTMTSTANVTTTGQSSAGTLNLFNNHTAATGSGQVQHNTYAYAEKGGPTGNWAVATTHGSADAGYRVNGNVAASGSLTANTQGKSWAAAGPNFASSFATSSSTSSSTGGGCGSPN